MKNFNSNMFHFRPTTLSLAVQSSGIVLADPFFVGVPKASLTSRGKVKPLAIQAPRHRVPAR